MMGTPTLVVGDLHGVSWVAERALETGLPVVFIGDYLDSFDKSHSDQIHTLGTVLNAAKTREDVTALMGNHELSYLNPNWRCSGYSPTLQARLMSDFDENDTYQSAMKKYLMPFTYEEGFLISHAGVSESTLRQHDMTYIEYLESGDMNLWAEVGAARIWGAFHNRTGGLFWCDWNKEFEPVEGLPQIVGHTRGKPGVIRQTGNSFCIDCIPHNYSVAVVAMIEEGQFSEYKLYL